MPLKRPFGVTLLLWLVLILTAWGAARCLAALQNWDVLIEFKSSLSPLYLSVTGVGWSVAGGVLLWSLLAIRPWSRRAILASTLIWLLEYWVERGILHKSPNPNLVFALIISALFWGMMLAIMTRKNTRNFFTRSEEYEQHHKNSNPE